MNRSKKEVTIYDIADALGVSPATVSRALKDHKSIGAETTKAVQAMAAKMGYRPNVMASSLRTNKTKTIGVITSWINRPFISTLISGIEEVATAEGYNVIISQSNDSYKKEVANVRTLLASRVDGLIVSLAMETVRYDHFLAFLKRGIPVVFVDRVCTELDTDRILIDNLEAGYNATKHLIDQGFLRIAHLAGAQHRSIYKDRQEGYLRALRDHGIKVDKKLIVYSGLSFDEGMESMERLLTVCPGLQAVFCANDTSALAVVKYAKDRGLQVPGDIAVVGFNDDPLASIIDPPLTTIAQPAIEMGRIAAQQVLTQRTHNELVKSETIVLKTRLVVRGSSTNRTVKDAVAS